MRIRLSAPRGRTKNPIQFWMVAGASSLLLTASMFSFCTRTVHADEALRGGPTVYAPPAPSSAFEAPVTPAKTFVAKPKIAVLRGLATWYGQAFHGRRTASGEVFDMNSLTACHNFLPFGTRVRVENLSNHKSVIVKITDRGRLARGRVIDLSYGAAKELAMVQAGVAKVSIEVLPSGTASSN